VLWKVCTELDIGRVELAQLERQIGDERRDQEGLSSPDEPYPPGQARRRQS
jgi:hypothetical protein